MRGGLALCVVTLLGAGCAAGPEPVAPAIAMPDAWAAPLGDTEGALPRADWWQQFDDPALQQWIEIALEQNLSIAAATARLAAARARTRATRSTLFPALDAFIDVTLRREDNDGPTSRRSESGATLSYDLDPAGGNRRRLQRERALESAATLALADVRRLTAGAVAIEYIEQRRAAARLALLDSSLALQQRTLEIVESRFRAGLSAGIDVDRAAADLARSRAQRGPLGAAQRNARNALALLAGEAHAEPVAFGDNNTVPKLNAAAGVGLPADLLRNRADVRVREQRLLAAMAEIGVAASALYPSLRLPGVIGYADSNRDDANNGWFASLGAQLDLPLFDAGRRRATVAIRRAEADAALAEYRESVLVALTETEDALASIDALQTRLSDLESAAAASDAAYRQLDALYREGLAGFIDVLDAQRILIDTREAILETRADLAVAHVALLVATAPAP